MSNPEPEPGWQRRRALSATLRVAATLVPVLASLAAGLLANRLLPAASTLPGAVFRSAAILIGSLPVLVVVDKAARRCLPLAALLQLSLVFPDQTPSRFRLALKGGSGRRLARAVGDAKANGLSDQPGEAAEQLVVLASAIGDHDRRTRGHSERVRLYAELIGEELGLDADDRAKLQWAALIHDIGKITVPPEILNKRGKPDPDEWAILQGHPAAGESLVAPVESWLGEWVHAIGGHHEKWDGSGYPRGLAGADIPRSAAIVAVADSFEVMTAVRSYKKAMTLGDGRREMTRCAGLHFSPEVVRAFLNLSIGDLRRSMGVFAALAHVPLLGRLTTAASYAPDTVSTAVTMTSSAATAGAGAVAVTAAVAVGSPSMAAASADIAPPAPPTIVVAAPAEELTGPASHRPAPPAAVRIETAPTQAPTPTATPSSPTTSAPTTTERAVVRRTSPTTSPARPRTTPSPATEPAATASQPSAAAVTTVVDTPVAVAASPPATAPSTAPTSAPEVPPTRGPEPDRGRHTATETPTAAPTHSNAGGNANGNGNRDSNGNGNGGSVGSGNGASSGRTASPDPAAPEHANAGGGGNAGGDGNGGSGGNGNAGGNGSGSGNGRRGK